MTSPHPGLKRQHNKDRNDSGISCGVSPASSRQNHVPRFPPGGCTEQGQQSPRGCGLWECVQASMSSSCGREGVLLVQHRVCMQVCPQGGPSQAHLWPSPKHPVLCPPPRPSPDFYCRGAREETQSGDNGGFHLLSTLHGSDLGWHSLARKAPHFTGQDGKPKEAE